MEIVPAIEGLIAMNKIQLGGIKILEGQSRIESSCDSGENELAGICYRLGAERINLALLTHIADDGKGKSVNRPVH